jgi:hypothetical protein
MKNNHPENAAVYSTWEQQLATNLNPLGLYRQKELKANLLFYVQTYCSLLSRYDHLEIEELSPCRSDDYLIGLEVRVPHRQFHFRATLNYELQGTLLIGKLSYYSTSSDQPRYKQLPANNHQHQAKHLVDLLNTCLLEELKSNL